MLIIHTSGDIPKACHILDSIVHDWYQLIPVLDIKLTCFGRDGGKRKWSSGDGKRTANICVELILLCHGHDEFSCYWMRQKSKLWKKISVHSSAIIALFLFRLTLKNWDENQLKISCRVATSKYGLPVCGNFAYKIAYLEARRGAN